MSLCPSKALRTAKTLVSRPWAGGQTHITLTITIKIEKVKPNVMTIEDAHQIATGVQNAIIQQTNASRVVVHTEPSS